jgi:hypothetical protein
MKKTAAAIIEAIGSSDYANPVFERARTALALGDYNPDSFFDAVSVLEAFSDAFGVRCYSLG